MVGDADESTSLAVDSLDMPHISYLDWETGHVMYAHRTGVGWQTQEVDGSRHSSLSTSIAVDALGNPLIAYAYQDGGLILAHWAGSVWYTETVASDAIRSYDRPIVLALDAEGRAHLGYHSGEGLKYAYWSETDWHFETLGRADSSFSFALDASGNGHFVYWQDRSLRYARWDGTAWHLSTVDSQGSVSLGPSIALARASTSRPRSIPHISYVDGTNGDLKYAYLIAPTGKTVFFPSLLRESVAR